METCTEPEYCPCSLRIVNAMSLVEAFLLLITVPFLVLSGDLKVDPKGYVAYCPCMGRFGNQADHFLGSLAFARAVDRTLILPPWVEYHPALRNSVQVPFDTYFKVEPLKDFVRVITMETFMKELAPSIWPPGERIVFCYQARTHGPKENDCNAKDGNPFGPFWDTFDIEFDRSEFYSPLFHDTKNLHDMERWKERYPPEKYPVLAFTGAPAHFPVEQHHTGLQKHVQWSDSINEKVDKFIEENIGTEQYLGIHLRLGSDFQNACEHIAESPMMFGAAQCLGYRMEHGTGTKEMCYPSEETIIQDVAEVLDETGVKTVFVATDSKDLIKKMSKVFDKVKFVRHDPANPHMDLAILGRADYFIGNCISTFTGFVSRERKVNGKPSKYWAFRPTKHEEL